MTELSISRSVSRAFQVLEYFRDARAPCSTPELEKALCYPYSSVRVILKSLRSLGYLDYREDEKTYFPTEKLMSLGSWVGNALLQSDPLMRLLSFVHQRLDETVAIAVPNFIFCNVVKVHVGSRPMALKVPDGIGLPLVQSAAGRVLLSQMGDGDIRRVMQHTQYWAGTTRAPLHTDLIDVQQATELVRDRGSLADFNRFTAGVGTVAYVVPSPFKDTPLALFLSGPTSRVQRDEVKIRRTIELYLASYRAKVLR